MERGDRCAEWGEADFKWRKGIKMHLVGFGGRGGEHDY
jgi:hypothetical protein